jgi:toxin YoeB
MRSVKFEPKAFNQIGEWLGEDRKMFQRILRILKECQRTPFEGVGKPEPLKGNLKGLWSRRITDEHRLVYDVTDELIIVFSMRGHYDDL